LRDSILSRGLIAKVVSPFTSKAWSDTIFWLFPGWRKENTHLYCHFKSLFLVEASWFAGHGIHLCLGMPLVRLEAEAALNQLLDRYPELMLAEQDLVWSDSPFFRGLEQLTVRGT
jgi:hypothetical protein